MIRLWPEPEPRTAALDDLPELPDRRFDNRANMTRARVYHINVSNGGAPKLPVPEVRITKDGVSGDRQRNPAIHGGPDRAVCLFSLEVIEALQAEGHSIAPGSSGENLTLAGLAWTELKPADRLCVGDAAELEITGYTAPCEQNARWFRDGDYKRTSQKRHPGRSRLYARVLSEGTVRPGDPVTVKKAMGNGQ